MSNIILCCEEKYITDFFSRKIEKKRLQSKTKIRFKARRLFANYCGLLRGKPHFFFIDRTTKRGKWKRKKLPNYSTH